MLDGARADAGEGLPEADRVVVTCCTEDHGHVCSHVEYGYAIDSMPIINTQSVYSLECWALARSSTC